MSPQQYLPSVGITKKAHRKRARYDSGEDLIDPSEMFGGGGMSGFGGGGGMQIDPEMLFNMMGAGGRGGFQFASGGAPFGGASFGGSPFGSAYGGPGMGSSGRSRGGQFSGGYPF
jgi:DnaJ homolog subfamily C member 7